MVRKLPAVLSVAALATVFSAPVRADNVSVVQGPVFTTSISNPLQNCPGTAPPTAAFQPSDQVDTIWMVVGPFSGAATVLSRFSWNGSLQSQLDVTWSIPASGGPNFALCPAFSPSGTTGTWTVNLYLNGNLNSLITSIPFTVPGSGGGGGGNGVSINLQSVLQQLNLTPGTYTNPTVLGSAGLTIVSNASGTPGAAGIGSLVIAAVNANERHPSGTTTEAFFFGPGIAYDVLNCTTLRYTGSGSLSSFTITRPGVANGASLPAWEMYAYDSLGNQLASTGEGNISTGGFYEPSSYANFSVSSSTPIASVVFCSHNGLSTYNALPLSGGNGSVGGGGGSNTLSVSASADIFAAGLSSPPPLQGNNGATTGGGSLPSRFLLPSNSAGEAVTFTSVTGTFQGCTSASSAAYCATVNPDGVALSGAATGGTNLGSYQGISGIEDDNRVGFLVGVFTGAAGCTGAPPSTLNFTNAAANATVSPSLCQTFFVGDGQIGTLPTAANGPQQFIIPNSAAYLYLGFADGGAFQGTPAYYDDDSGSMTATIQIVPASSGGGGGGNCSAQAPVSGIVAWWKFDENGGTTTCDSSGDGNTGTLTGGPAWVPGQVNSALSFGNGYVVSANGGGNGLPGGNAARTIAAWVKTTNNGNDQAIFHYGENGQAPSAANFHLLIAANGAVRFGNGFGYGYLTGVRTVTDGKWHHVAGVWNGSTASLYVDGVLDKSGALSESSGPGSPAAPNTVTGGAASPWRIGLFQSNTGEFAGAIDELQVYGRALSTGEVGTLVTTSGGTIGGGSGGGNGGNGAGSITGMRLEGGTYSTSFASNGQIWDTTPNSGYWVLGVTQAGDPNNPLLNAADRSVNIPPGNYYIYNQPTSLGTAVRITINWSNGQTDQAVFSVGSLTSATQWTWVAGSTNISLASTGLTNVKKVSAGLTPGAADDVLLLGVQAGSGGGGGGGGGGGSSTCGSPITATLVLCLDASSGLAANGSTWADLSGQGHNATALSGQAPALGTMNGRTAAQFTGNQTLSIAGQVLTSQQFTVVAVVTDATSSSASYRDVFSDWNSATPTSSVFLGDTGFNPERVRFTDSVGGQLQGQTGQGTLTNATSPFVLAGVASANNAAIYQNSNLLYQLGSPISPPSLASTYYIGRQGAQTSEYWNGLIGEVLVFNSALSASDYNAVVTYLTNKWVGSGGGGNGAGSVTGIQLEGGTYSTSFASNGQIWDTTPNSGYWVLGVSQAGDPNNPLLNAADKSVNIPPGNYYTYDQPTSFGTAVRFTIHWSNGQTDQAVFSVGSLTSATQWTRVAGSTNISLASTGLTNVKKVSAGLTPGAANDVLLLGVQAGSGGGGGGGGGGGAGTVYLTTNQSNGIQVFSVTGTPAAAVPGSSPHQYSDLVFDQAGNLYSLNGPVQNPLTVDRFTPTGSVNAGFIADASIHDGFLGLAVDTGGNIWLGGIGAVPSTLVENGALYKAAPAGGTPTQYIVTGDPNNIQFLDVLADQQTAIFNSNGNSNLVQAYNVASGTLSTFWTVPAGSSASWVKRIRGGPYANNILVLTSTGRSGAVYMLSPSGSVVKVYTAGNVAIASALAVDPAGTDFWVGGGNGNVAAVNLQSGNVDYQWSSCSTAPCPGIWGIAIAGLSSGGSGGSGSPALTLTSDSSTTAHDLTQESNLAPGGDWIHFGDPTATPVRKAGGGNQISTPTSISSAGISQYSNAPEPLQWSDGTPIAKSTNNINGEYVRGQGSGFQFTVPADTSTRTLIVHVGGDSATGMLTATLSESDNSALVRSDTTQGTTSGQFVRNYMLTYQAGSSGQHLTVTWTQVDNGSNVRLDGIALSGPGAGSGTGGGGGNSGNGCAGMSLSPAAQPASAAGGTYNVTVAAPSGCSWTAVPNNGFIQVASGGSGMGNGTVTFSVQANSGVAQPGSITIGTQTEYVFQNGTPVGATVSANCVYVPASALIVPVPLNGTSSTPIQFTTGPGCAWSAAVLYPPGTPTGWVNLIPPFSGTSGGRATVSFSVPANTTSNELSASIVIAGITWVITQAGPGPGGSTVPPGTPNITQGGVTNAASYAGSPPNAIAQGSFFSIFGTTLGPNPYVQGQNPLPSTQGLGGVTVQIIAGGNTYYAYLVFVSSAQINAILPSNVPPGNAQVIVTYNGTSSAPLPIIVSATSLGVFFQQVNGNNVAIAQNAVGSYPLNVPSAPAKPGQIVIIWGTGLGPVNGPDNVPPGSNAVNLLGPPANLQVSITVGGVTVPASQILYAGRQSESEAVDNIYFTLPGNVPTGCQIPVAITVAGVAANAANIAISADGLPCQ